MEGGEVPLPRPEDVYRAKVNGKDMVRYSDYVTVHDRLSIRSEQLEVVTNDLSEVRELLMESTVEKGLGRTNMLKKRGKLSVEDLENQEVVIQEVGKLFPHYPYPPDNWQNAGQEGDGSTYDRLMGPIKVPRNWNKLGYWSKKIRTFALSAWVDGRQRYERILKCVNDGKSRETL